MASFLDKVKVNTAITDNTKLDLSHQQITTGDFMQLNVATMQELVPGTKLSVNMESFARLNPLVVPTFGRASMRNRAFFVPFRTIFRGWNDFITDSPHVFSDGYTPGSSARLLQKCPTVTMEALCHAFLDYVGSSSTDGSGMIYVVTPNASNNNWDIQWTSSGVTTYYCYTVKGRQALKLIEQLGYKLDWNNVSKDVILSALPLLALGKIWADWYCPQQYTNRVEYDIILSYCNYDVDNSQGITLGAPDVNTILSLVSYVQYDSDLFVSAWDQPNSPNAGNYSSNFKLLNIDTIGEVFSNNSNTYNVDKQYVTNNSGSATSSNRLGGLDAPFATLGAAITGSTTNSATVGGISEYLLHGLHALTDYMKRHQLAGSRAMDRYLARFGKALSAEKLNRSLYLGSHMQDIMIGDVMSTADTDGAQLGAFSGKGISHGSGSYQFDTDEYGYFIILSSIVPATGYFQGIDPVVMRTTKLDYFTPEFDSLGVEPIKAANLFIPQVAGQMSTGDPYSQIFGFVPRYASYKASTCMDRLTGNFRIPSINAGNFVNSGNSWHLMRTFKSSDFSNDYANVVHDPSFISGSADFSQYKRLFYNDDADAPDNFTIIHNFNIAEYAPMKSLFDSYEFEDKGKKVTLETNGVKLN